MVNSGVIVARSLELGAVCDNMGDQLLREAASQSCDMVSEARTPPQCWPAP